MYLECILRRGCALVFGNHGEASQDVHHFISAAARKLASDTCDRLGARSEDEAYSCHVQRFRRDVGIAVAREFARYRLLRVPFVGVPRAVIRDRHAGRRERGGESGASSGSDNWSDAGRLLQASGQHLAGEVSSSSVDVGRSVVMCLAR